uniref:Uncharacterized protein n=1 Tax=Tetranychus urticae TaxID=32264 RepID=T1L4J9_TETUR
MTVGPIDSDWVAVHPQEWQGLKNDSKPIKAKC